MSDLSRAMLRNDASEPPRLALRPRDAARSLGISPRKLWEITADQASGIPHIRLGRAVIYPVAQLEAWLGRQTRGASDGN